MTPEMLEALINLLAGSFLLLVILILVSAVLLLHDLRVRRVRANNRREYGAWSD